MEKTRPFKLAVIGAESTGKTALSEALSKHFATGCVPEYAREYFEDSDIYNYSLEDLEHIALKQVEQERRYMTSANGLLVCDTALVTLQIWAELEFGFCPESIHQLMEQNPYDHYLITSNEVPWQSDPLRQNKFSRDLIFNLNIEACRNKGASYSLITGLGEHRLNEAIKLTRQALANKT